jgi:hypothetical protein
LEWEKETDALGLIQQNKPVIPQFIKFKSFEERSLKLLLEEWVRVKNNNLLVLSQMACGERS